MPVDPSVQAGARQIVQRCLGLRPDQELVIFVDETTVEPAVAIAEAAEALRVPHTVILVPVAVQRRVPMQSDLSLVAQGAARDARAILTCVNASPECMAFRDRILETAWTARTRIGHMPGASLEVLRLADVDCDRLIADCHRLEVVLARGRTLELISHEPGGREHRLTVDIGGWERLPVASDGVIGDGAWGNVPSGETYIAPMANTAEGSVVIDGSVPGMVLEPGEQIVLHFVEGRLSAIEPEDGPAARWLHETQIQSAQARGDRNWSHLAEVGVGMNPAVERLTGNMLFDEKAAGTAHVALGSNIYMGGTIDASIHCDMVFRAPTVLVDGKVVVERGWLRFVESEWREHYGRVDLGSSPLRVASLVTRSGLQVDTAPDGRLQRVLRPEPGRVSTCSVGDDETARLAQRLYMLVPDGGEWLAVDTLVTRARMEPEVARQVLHVLWTYHLIRYR
ncbi:MAG: aminopeptidase [Anaerolineae bacterium]